MSEAHPLISFFLCTDGIDESGCCEGERGVLAPGEIDVADERGRKRTEHDAVGELLGDHPVDADRRAEAHLKRADDDLTVNHGGFCGRARLENFRL